MSDENPVGIKGIEFIEFASPEPQKLHDLFLAFGFSHLKKHQEHDIHYYRQNDIHILLNREPNTFAANFAKMHGPSISSMGWRVDNAGQAQEIACERGANGHAGETIYGLPAIYGIGESLLYMVDDETSYLDAFDDLESPTIVDDLGFQNIDHLTNNVKYGTMTTWSNFYKDVFGFTEVRYFDIRGVKTGLMSFALRSPCTTFCIPINEGTEAKSQINEYLEEYNGPGIQHLAFASNDLLDSLDRLDRSQIDTLDIDDDYYDEVFERVPNVTEDRARVQEHQVLIDGDEEGYLLQIFTKNIIGPIFIEMIQRKNHHAFGEGNFGALFRAIERDQEKRGYL